MNLQVLRDAEPREPYGWAVFRTIRESGVSKAVYARPSAYKTGEMGAQEECGGTRKRHSDDRPEPDLAGFGQAATPAPGLIPDFLDEALVPLDAELDDDIHQEVEQALDVVPGELAPSVALFHEQHQLFERQLAASGMDASDGTGVTGVHIAQVVEGFFRAQLGEENPVRLHAKTALQELLRGHAREPLIVLRVKETDVILVGVENEFLGVLDSDESLGGRDFPNQRLGPGGLAGTGRT